MKRFCIPLELIAFAIHPGDTQSTTTVCWDQSCCVLYLTSQTNAAFDGVDVPAIHAILDFLTLSAALYAEKQIEIPDVKSHYWEQHCALHSKEAGASPTAMAKINKIYEEKGVYDRIWKRFLAANFQVSEIQGMKAQIWQVRVIQDTDIFHGRAPEKTGFHGESRILRFLFIRDYPGVHLQRANGFFYNLPGDALGAQTKTNAYDWFKAHISPLPIAMGSSQGTCQGCATCLDDYQIAHGDPENAPQQWLDPLTLCGYQGQTRIVKADSHHAIYPAFKYLIRPKDDSESSNSEG